MGIAGVALRVSGGEDGVDEDKGADDLGAKAGAFIVTVREHVGAAAVGVEVGLLEGLHQAHSGDGTQALSHHVSHRPNQGNLPRQKQPERHCRVDVPACSEKQDIMNTICSGDREG